MVGLKNYYKILNEQVRSKVSDNYTPFSKSSESSKRITSTVRSQWKVSLPSRGACKRAWRSTWMSPQHRCCPPKTGSSWLTALPVQMLTEQPFWPKPLEANQSLLQLPKPRYESYTTLEIEAFRKWHVTYHWTSPKQKIHYQKHKWQTK